MAAGEAEYTEWVPNDPPYQLSYLWRWFLELHVARHFRDKGGADPISYHDMLAWSKLTDRKPGPFDIKTIRQLDQRYFYVLRTPDGAAPQYLDNAKAEQQIAAALRAMSQRNKYPPSGQTILRAPDASVTALPDNKPVTAPVSRRGK